MSPYNLRNRDGKLQRLYESLQVNSAVNRTSAGLYDEELSPEEESREYVAPEDISDDDGETDNSEYECGDDSSDDQSGDESVSETTTHELQEEATSAAQNSKSFDKFIVKRKNFSFERFKQPIESLDALDPTANSHGPKGDAKNAKTPLQAFNLYVDNEMIRLLTQNTYLLINKIKENYNYKSDVRPVTEIEMKAFIGILIGIGVLQAGHLNYNDIFNDVNFSGDFFNTTMSSKRFLFILRSIRFDDINTRAHRIQQDKLAPIRDLFDNFVEKCNNYFDVSDFATVDEQLVAFRGRCSFKQYMPNKPYKYGKKIFALCCSRTFYNKKMEIYVGKRYTESMKIDNSGKAIVLRLSDCIQKTSRNVIADNWFMSIPLAETLLKDYTLTSVGTLKTNLEFL